jgi:hypothetical protein
MLRTWLTQHHLFTYLAPSNPEVDAIPQHLSQKKQFSTVDDNASSDIITITMAAVLPRE